MADNFAFEDISELINLIPDGTRLALPSENSGVPMALVRAIITSGRKGLRLVGGPTGGIAIDMLVGSGCVASVEAAGISLGPRGLAPRFGAAVEAGSIEMMDSTCPATHAGFIAGEKRLPFLAVRGVFGSDVLANRTDWKVIENPFPPNDPIVVVPAILPDVTAFHAPFADRTGNVWVGNRREIKTMARAAGKVLVTVEKIIDGNAILDEKLAPGLLTRPYIDHIAVAPKGAWPTALPTVYGPDDDALDAYATAARDKSDFDAFMKDFLSKESVL